MLVKWFKADNVPKSLVDEVLAIINAHTGKPVNRETLTTIQERIDDFFRDLPSKWVLFDGVRVVGAQLQLIDGIVSFYWRTEFYPKQRHQNQYGKVIPLGYYGRHDLWVVKHGGVPPVVLARYGDGVSDYVCISCSLNVEESSEPLVEAYNRAGLLGALDTSIPLDPKPDEEPKK